MLDKLRAFWAKINTDLQELWAKDKLFVAIFGMLILIVKFRNIAIDLLVSNGKQIANDAQKKDETLAAQENQDKAAADKLEEQAKEEPSKETTVDSDWYKKK